MQIYVNLHTDASPNPEFLGYRFYGPPPSAYERVLPDVWGPYQQHSAETPDRHNGGPWARSATWDVGSPQIMALAPRKPLPDKTLGY